MDEISNEGAGAPAAMDTPAACARALLWGFDTAFARRARQITCVSPRFDTWPLDELALNPVLTQWLRLPQRQLRLLSADFDSLDRAMPRFSQWRRDFVHAVCCWRCPAELVESLPTALFDDDTVSVRLFDVELGLGRASVNGRTRLLLAQETDVLLQRSEAAWPVRTLGI